MTIGLSPQVGDIAGWVKPILPKGTFAVAVVNMGNYGRPTYFTKAISEFGLHHPNGYKLTETFDGKSMGPFNLTDHITLNLVPTGMFLATAIPIQ